MIHVKGDIFDVARIAAQAGLIALGHGANCRGMMGAGIALEFRERFAANYASYLSLTELAGYNLAGSAQLVNDVIEIESFHKRPLIVANLYTQNDPGPHARLDYISSALEDAFKSLHNRALQIPLLIPMIGAGIGGLNPADVLSLFNSFGDKLVVVEYDK